MNQITLLLAEDHVVVREGLRMMLQLEADLEVIGEAQDGRQAIALTTKLRPDVVLMDIAMPKLNGLEATRQLCKALPATRVLMLSAHSDDAYVKSAAEAGALGFLLKQSSAHELCAAVRVIHKGGTFFSADVSRRSGRFHLALPGDRPRRDQKPILLTSRETEVLQLIAEGMANKQTAAELGISIKTVEKHRDHLMQKLDIHDTASLTRYAISTGIIENSVQATVI